MPKSYGEFKQELRENLDEIKLTGSSKTFWEYLAKLIGEKKANQRREKAIEQKSKITCVTRDGVVIEAKRKELEKRLKNHKD
ncbi:MAG: hypothetical protein NWF10_02345 [Candidatus Bathyarchaeota archaeon]|nr:hypothetical protein [Candidatus Bathyarchaeota archaeon]